MREIRLRTRVAGCFPDGESALMLVSARLRHLTGRKWGTVKYMDMEKMYGLEDGWMNPRRSIRGLSPAERTPSCSKK